MGKNVTIPIGFIIGIYLDILTNKQVGISAILFVAVGILGGVFDKNFSKDGKIAILLMVAGSTILFETIGYLYTSARYLIPLQMLGFIKIVLIEVMFNILLTIILYPLIRRTGYFLENTFKKRKILTKYF